MKMVILLAGDIMRYKPTWFIWVWEVITVILIGAKVIIEWEELPLWFAFIMSTGLLVLFVHVIIDIVKTFIKKH